MANIFEVRYRIKSIRKTKQITRAMYLISASKLKRARLQLEQTMPYFNKVRETMNDILFHSPGISNMYFGSSTEKKEKRKGFIVITGDRGLAGSFNNIIIRLAEQQLKENPQSSLFVIGYIGKSYFLRKEYNIDTNLDFFLQNPSVHMARDIADVMYSRFTKGELDEIYIIYTKMVSATVLEPSIMQLLPLTMDDFTSNKELQKHDGNREEITYEPSPDYVLNVLVPKYIKGIIYGAMVESFTSEQSARMMAMDNATRNAEEMLDKLNIVYNRARQAAITQEISEIIGGATALS